MNKPACKYKPADVYELEARGLKLAQELSDMGLAQESTTVRELSGVLLNQAVRLAQVRMALEVKGDG